MRRPTRAIAASPTRRALALLLLGASALAAGSGCRSEMYDQARYEPMEPSPLFADGLSARPLVAGTIPRGWARTDEHLYFGRDDGRLAETFPYDVDEAMLVRGKDLYGAFCTPCHGGLGDGRGMIVERGFPMPPSFHERRLVEAPVGHYFDVISRGYGAMYAYDHRVKPHDRWAITAYIRALQLSQAARVEGLPEDDRRQVEEAAR